jgi:hypothetical protein
MSMDLRQTQPETQKRKKKMLWKVFEEKKCFQLI